MELRRSQGASLKILTTQEHRLLKSRGRSCSGYNIVFSGLMSYNFERQIKGFILQEGNNDVMAAVHEGQPVRGVYKIIDIQGNNDSRYEREGHGYHHSNQIFKCLYNRFTDADFLEDEVIEIMSYPLWQSVAIRNANRLQVGDVFEVESFELIESPYTCYQTKWHLVTRQYPIKTNPYSCATEGFSLPEEYDEVNLGPDHKLDYYLETLRLRINSNYKSDYPLISRAVMNTIAREQPHTFDELQKIKGVGPYIIQHYGGLILSVILNYRRIPSYKPTASTLSTNPSSPKKPVSVSTRRPHQKGDSALESANLYHNGYSVEQIARTRGVKIQTIYNHLFQTDCLDAEDYITSEDYARAKDIYDAQLEDRADRIRDFLDDAAVSAFFHLRRQEV